MTTFVWLTIFNYNNFIFICVNYISRVTFLSQYFQFLMRFVCLIDISQFV